MNILNSQLMQFVIEKNNRQYIISETSTMWRVKHTDNKLTVAFEISKESYPTFEMLKDYILTENPLF